MSLTFFPSDCNSELHCSQVNQGCEVTLKSKVIFVPANGTEIGNETTHVHHSRRRLMTMK